MIARNVGFDEIYDLVGIRVLVDSVRDCYAALGTIHARWNPIPGRFKDYIAMPKFNMYQSLHTTVIGPEGKPVELQIRTWGMHRRAEYGVAAHWKYKEESLVPGGRNGASAANDMVWLRQLVDWQRETADPAEFLESLRFDLGAAEVYVFTPKGQVIALPQGATPVDFAYAIHTEVGHRCIGARVNGRLVALESALDNGDTVEIFTSKAPDAGPSRDWLGFVKSARARNKIRHWFSKERREAAAETGKTAIARAMRKQGLPLQRMATGDALLAIATEMRLRRPVRAVRGRRRGPRQRPVRGQQAGPVGGRRGGRPGRPRRDRAADPPAAAQPRHATRAWWSRARPTSGPGCPAAAPPCRGTRSPGSSPGATVSRCTVPTAPTCGTCSTPSRSAWWRSAGRRPRTHCSWSRSRWRPSTGPGCCPTSPAPSRTSTSTSCPRR